MLVFRLNRILSESTLIYPKNSSAFLFAYHSAGGRSQRKGSCRGTDMQRNVLATYLQFFFIEG